MDIYFNINISCEAQRYWSGRGRPGLVQRDRAAQHRCQRRCPGWRSLHHSLARMTRYITQGTVTMSEQDLDQEFSSKNASSRCVLVSLTHS